jgi:fluoride exporter
MRGYLLVFVGGGMGAALRHGINVAFARWFGIGFPFHTLFENVSGSIAMGLLASYFVMTPGSSQSLRLFLTTGILGGYTTFSAFSLDTVLLIERDQYGLAAIYVVASVLASVVGLALGVGLVRFTA